MAYTVRLGGDPNLQVRSPFGSPSSKFLGEVDLEDFSADSPHEVAPHGCQPEKIGKKPRSLGGMHRYWKDRSIFQVKKKSPPQLEGCGSIEIY